MRRIGPFVAVVLCSALASSLATNAWAGGFETPDNGTEALGRGGAFTAKASDATALTYNIAGLAGQRGTRILFDGKISINNYSFTRDGTYLPQVPTATQPWGNSFFPTVSNQGPPFFAPFIGISSDFGYFDRLTFAAGVFGPSGVGNPTFPLGVAGAPSPSRYDVIQATSSIILPTVAAAYRVNDWLDVGLAGHYVLGKFDLINVSYVDLGCPNYEAVTCDTTNHLVMSGSTFTASGGAMLHPASWLDIGLNVRGPISITAQGTATSTTYAGTANSGAATFSTSLPPQIRLGARTKFMDGNFEQGDIELDGVYEPWSSTGLGPTVNIPEISGFTNVESVVLHKFLDVYSVRFGGAYNIRTTPDSIFTLRAGGYYESPSTAPADTRVDFNTLEKFAGTIGAGFQYRGIGVNVAYAGIYSPERVVTDGEIRPINPAPPSNGGSLDANKNLLPAVNNGIYNGFIHMIAFGVRVEIETLFGTKRSKRWTPQGELPFENIGGETTGTAPPTDAKREATSEEPKPDVKAAVEPKPAATPPSAPKPADKPAEKKRAKPTAAPPPTPASAPPPVTPPTPAPNVKPAKPTPTDEENERKLEDPFAK
jgi:long-chain fatty acid transport protein